VRQGTVKSILRGRRKRQSRLDERASGACPFHGIMTPNKRFHDSARLRKRVA
jgi:hypothetical protein